MRKTLGEKLNDNFMIPKIIHFCWFGGNPLPELAQKCIASWRKYLPEYEIWQWGENLNADVKVNDTLCYDTERSSYDTQGKPCYDTPAATKTKENSLDTELLKEQEISQIDTNLSNNNDNNINDNLVPSSACLSTNGAQEPSERLESSVTRVMEFDVNIIPFTAEAYRQRKYAFVSDYARFWILHKYGGLYFDTDVEVIRPMDEIIAKGNFLGFETDPDGENSPGKYAPRYCYSVAPGLGMGFEQKHPFLKVMMDKYATLEYETPVFPWGKTIVAYTTEELCKMGLRNVKGVQEVSKFQVSEFQKVSGFQEVSEFQVSGFHSIRVYPHEYFAPIDVITGRLHITDNTYTIHQYMGSWDVNRHYSWMDRIKSIVPEWLFYVNNKIKRRRYKIKK